MGERVGSEYSFDLGTVQSHHSERERNVIHAELQSGVVRDNSGDCADCVFVFRYGYSVNPTDLIADLEENHRTNSFPKVQQFRSIPYLIG